MERGDLSDAALNPKEPEKAAARLTLLTMFQLGLFQMGLGMMSVLALGVLNRVMIKELAIPSAIALGIIALHQVMSLTRVWFGQLSDSKPFLGYHRTSYVRLGTLLLALSAFLTVQTVWQVGRSLQTQGWMLPTYGWLAVLSLMFVLYGLTLSSSSTPFAALLVDVSDEEQRPKLVGIVWFMLLVGVVIGSITIGVLTKRLDLNPDFDNLQASINRVFMVVPAIVVALSWLATLGVEKKYSYYSTRSTQTAREDQFTLGAALRILTASPQTGLFFTFLLLMTLSLFMQDGVMEPYGSEVFQMKVSETTAINAWWGLGTMAGLMLAGFLLAPRLGKQNTAKVGCVLVAISMVLMVLGGLTHNPLVLNSVVFVFGFASGVTTNGALSLMLDLTVAQTAGTFIGAWGVAQAGARAIATFTGGAVLNIGKSIFSDPVFSYGLVFCLQGIGIIVAVFLLSRVNVQEFRTNTRQAIAAVFQSDLD